MQKEIRIKAALNKSLNRLTRKELINLVIDTETILRSARSAADPEIKINVLLNEKFLEEIPGYVLIEF